MRSAGTVNVRPRRIGLGLGSDEAWIDGERVLHNVGERLRLDASAQDTQCQRHSRTAQIDTFGVHDLIGRVVFVTYLLKIVTQKSKMPFL
jgi:hypothetical protein